MFKISIPLVFCILISASCSQVATEIQPKGQETQVGTPLNDSVTVMQLADNIAHALKKGDYRSIGDAVGNDGKVRFSPYATVDSLQNSLSKIELYASPHVEMAWGNFDGSGDKIQLSINNYFKKFVYNRDYASDPTVQIAYNRSIGTGNSLNNLTEFYPNHHFVEFYYPGTAEYDKMDWSALRLVFKKVADSFLLVGIVHDQWTI